MDRDGFIKDGDTRIIRGEGWIYDKEFELERKRKKEVFNKKYSVKPYVDFTKEIQNRVWSLYQYNLKTLDNTYKKQVENLLLLNRGLFFNPNVMIDYHFNTLLPKVNEYLNEICELYPTLIPLIDKGVKLINLHKISCIKFRSGFSDEWYENNPTEGLDYRKYLKYGWNNNPNDLEWVNGVD